MDRVTFKMLDRAYREDKENMEIELDNYKVYIVKDRARWCLTLVHKSGTILLNEWWCNLEWIDDRKSVTHFFDKWTRENIMHVTDERIALFQENLQK